MATANNMWQQLKINTPVANVFKQKPETENYYK